MSPLLAQLARRIRETGPLSVADYMATVLGDPRHGYYTGRDPLGAAGDFTTAPEVSQMFGELIGLWCVDSWRAQGAPAPLRLVELGPGRGTLMADLLRAARLAPDFLAAVDIHLVEISPALRRRQRERLAGQPVTWHESFEQVPDGPLLLLANEFFDALPIRQLQRFDDGWAERVIGLDATGEALVFGLGARLPEAADGELPPGRPGAVAELCPAAVALAEAIATRIAARGGAALIVDYGYSGPACGDSLQAVRGHRRHDVLAEPGSADLTAHVDFAALARAARRGGGGVHGPQPQGRFLDGLGIAARAATLCENATPAQRRDIAAALHRLTDPQAMGELFKVMAVTPATPPPPAGFPVPAEDPQG